MPYPPDNPPLRLSILAGREVSTWSEEWKHECEVRFLARLPLAQRNDALDGSPGSMKYKRGEAAVAHLRPKIERYAGLKAKP